MQTKILDLLRSRERFTILSHVDPDGDALGSALGLAAILKDMGKQAVVGVPGGTPTLYRFLPGAADVRGEAAKFDEKPDVVVAVDATSPSRLAGLAELIDGSCPVVNIDHHADNARFGDLQWIDPTASAAALMVMDLATSANLPLGRDAANALYVGILTDTGRFTFANTDPRTLRAAAHLTECGADPHRLAAAVYENRSVPSLRLRGLAFATLDLRDDGRVASMHVTQAMLKESGALEEDADGLSTQARTLAGVKVGVFLRETISGNIKISFRSNEGVEINGVAQQFGGGGHPRASGARVPGPLEQAKESILNAVIEHLGSNSS